LKTIITKIKGDWQDVVNACRATVSKPPIGHEPSTEFKTKILISEHSPIRLISFLWDWKQIKSWVATHWSRHKFEKFIETQRTDRTGIYRDNLGQGELVDFKGDANVQHLIDAFRKRLCYTASPETRQLGEDFKTVLREIQPEISDVLVPNCVYRCGCPEMKMCKNKTWPVFLAWCRAEKHVDVQMLPIQRRYDLYNKWFYLNREEPK
jgi:hypothetical protein